ncbi:DNA translocase FtsK [Candidatus Uhrbacteria bacterium]|nr:DNA translocase FtsK [Candidatus Uhrbacteria bacterium]
MARRRRRSFDAHLDPDTRRGIVVVFLFAVAVLLLLSIFDIGGAFGQAINDGISSVFGWDKIIVPFVLAAWGYHFLSPDRLPLRITNTIGFILFFLTLNPLVHAITFPSGGVIDANALRVAGGKLGESIAVPLMHMLGLAGVVTITTALFIVSLLLVFNAGLSEVLFVFRWIGKMIAWIVRAMVWPFNTYRERKARAALGVTDEGQPPLNVRTQTVEDGSGEEKEGEEEIAEGEGEGEREEEAHEPPPKPKKRYPRIEIPLELLERRDQRPTSGDINHNREVIRRTLDKFGIPVEMGEVSVGPTVTQFTLKPSDGIKLSRITGLHNDLALALAAHPIRIEAPIPGKSLVGLEVPNQSVATVGLREILESREFRDRRGNLTFSLGKDVSGKPWVADLGKMPHLLVAGATGSGKSVCLNTVIMSFLYANGPDECKFIMVDPKRVELQVYNGIPHLVTPVITKVPETVNALKWALREMDRRYDLLAKFGARDLASYNARVQDKMPHLVFLIDELADLMASSRAEVEGPIVRLAQMSRAVGIHLVLATQRPSVDVITGLIKANVPARIAFAVASQMDSRTILDQQGADRLLGRGDMLLSTAEMATPKRIQGSFVSEAEIVRVVEFIKSKYDPAEYDTTVVERDRSGTVLSGGGGDDDYDPLIPEAKEEIIRAGKASASLLQRRLKVGYARAARLLDLLEQEGFIGPGDGAKPREILKVEFTKGMDQIPAPAQVSEEEREESEEDETMQDT